jgi:hypothetical protein
MHSIFFHRIISDVRRSLFQKSRCINLKTGSHILAVLLGYKKRAKQNASRLSYRIESLDFFDVPESLRGVSLLFLTDPHIGGNIDILAENISLQMHTLLDGVDPQKTIILHGGDFICESEGVHMTTEESFHTVAPQLFR